MSLSHPRVSKTKIGSTNYKYNLRNSISKTVAFLTVQKTLRFDVDGDFSKLKETLSDNVNHCVVTPGANVLHVSPPRKPKYSTWPWLPRPPTPLVGCTRWPGV
ncbi:hypothetical protein ElyMa_005624800 [Elysia marginata]|uniref:Uncharacterized protein n=1 Tax=Elysia marginata TaxID=1093978 RepID=A0AAV4F7K6_9GAST|nr:hypothetical protein ElyMa_005624800 [Elysia marginata]